VTEAKYKAETKAESWEALDYSKVLGIIRVQYKELNEYYTIA